MSIKLFVLAVAVIASGPALAGVGGGSSGGSTATSAGGGGNSGGGGHGGDGGHGGGGGGHGGGASGAGGHFGGGLGGRGAAASAHIGSFAHGGAEHGNAHFGSHAGTSRAARPLPGQHVALYHSASVMAGTDRHHHHHPHNNRREPFYGNTFTENPYVDTCLRVLDDPRNPWDDCFGAAKRSPAKGAHRGS